MPGPMFYGLDPLFTRFVGLVDNCPLICNDICRCDGHKAKCLRLWDTASTQSSQHHITTTQYNAYVKRFHRIAVR